MKHEYVGGVVYAMAVRNSSHNIIATNILVLLHGKLRGKKCRPFNSDTKIRVRLPTHGDSIIPTVPSFAAPIRKMILFKTIPSAIFEGSFEVNKCTDEGEKKDAYLTIPSLSVYAIVEANICTSRDLPPHGNGIRPGSL